MEMSPFSENGRFVLTGECPYGLHTAAFVCVTDSFNNHGDLAKAIWVAVLRCVSCHSFILGMVGTPAGGGPVRYLKHYPRGTPNDSVSEDVPEEVRGDFKEAIRCRWIEAHKATVLLCRRALQVSCDREHAKGNDLFTQIDDLASRQRITEPLKKMAHRIRLLGKKGAHGDFSDVDDTITAKDADDALTFMYHYLEHVYILPARLDAGSP